MDKKKKAILNKIKNVFSGDTPSKGNKRKLTVAEAAHANKNRSEASKKADRRQTASHLSTTTNWLEHPDQYDYPGVDTDSSYRSAKKKSKKTTSKRKPSNGVRKLTVAEAAKINKLRSEASKIADRRQTSNVLDTTTRWAKDPGNSDYPGIDTDPSYRSKRKR